MSGTNGSQQTEFYVSRAGESQGPFSIIEIVMKMGRAEIAVTDFVYDETRAEWIPVLDCTAILAAVRSAKPQAPPPPRKMDSQSGQHSPPGQQNQPAQQIQHVQQQAIQQTMQVIHPAHAHETAQILMVQTESPKEQAHIIRRQFERVPFTGEVLVHDDRRVWLGEAYEAGEGGSGLRIEYPSLAKGQVLRLHFSSHEGLPAFNAVSEIVSKRAISDHGGSSHRSSRAPLNYGMKFLKIDASAERTVREFFRARAKG
jgi:hypothetical protein